MSGEDKELEDLNAADFASPSTTDREHLNEAGHAALAEAIYNATGVRLTELPMTPEKIAMGILKKKAEQK